MAAGSSFRKPGCVSTSQPREPDMNTAANTALAPLDPMEIGPACQKLTPRQFRFAVAYMFDVAPGTGAAEAAATLAGYEAEPKSLRAHARKLLSNPNIVAAIEELARQRLTLDVPQALETLRKAMADQYSKDKVKAAGMLLDRVLPTKQELTVKAETVDHTKLAIDHLKHLKELGASRDLLLREFGEIGLARWEELLAQREAAKPPVLEGEFTIVPGGTTPEEPAKPQPERATQEITGEPDDLDDETEEF